MKNIVMIGAGSGFVVSVARELVLSDVLGGSTFGLMDIDEKRLKRGKQEVDRIMEGAGSGVVVKATMSLDEALEGCDYVITSCEQSRYPFWVKDIRIPDKHGVYQIKGENGGPGGLIHGMRNISLFMGILAAMEKHCPDAWLMNFTNPMSILCTYFKNYSPIKALGFCHQVHGSFGVIAEQLGMEPGELEVISGGINHLNWLFDIRRKGTGESCMEEFLSKVRNSKYWKGKFDNVPRQEFTLEILDTFGAYPIGYDEHIIEYLPFFYEKDEWETFDCESKAEMYERLAAQGDEGRALEAMTLQGIGVEKPPFPRDDTHPYYAEKPCEVMEALETNTPTYLDAVNIVNHGSISNLPDDAIVDIPAVVAGGSVRGIHLGELPIGPMEICRRQITLHEMIARATHEGDESLAVQALCVDPYVHSITQARAIWRDYKKEFADYLPTFARG